MDEHVVSFSRHMRRINAAIIAVPVSRKLLTKTEQSKDGVQMTAAV